MRAIIDNVRVVRAGLGNADVDEAALHPGIDHLPVFRRDVVDVFVRSGLKERRRPSATLGNRDQR